MKDRPQRDILWIDLVPYFCFCEASCYLPPGSISFGWPVRRLDTMKEAVKDCSVILLAWRLPSDGPETKGVQLACVYTPGRGLLPIRQPERCPKQG